MVLLSDPREKVNPKSCHIVYDPTVLEDKAVLRVVEHFFSEHGFDVTLPTKVEQLQAATFGVVVLDGFTLEVLLRYAMLLGRSVPVVLLKERAATFSLQQRMNVTTDPESHLRALAPSLPLSYLTYDRLALTMDEGKSLVLQLERALGDTHRQLQRAVEEWVEPLSLPPSADRDAVVRALQRLAGLALDHMVPLREIPYGQRRVVDMGEADRAAIKESSTALVATVKQHQLELPTTAWLLLGNLSLSLDESEKALRFFDQAIKGDPDYQRAWFNKGVALHYLDRANEALHCYDRALQLDPDDANAWFGKGRIQQQGGRPEEAALYFDKALFLDPQHAYAANHKGEVLADLDAAERQFRTAIALRRKYVDPWVNLGDLQVRRSDYAVSLETYEEAIAVDPNSERAWLGKAHANELLGRIPEARDCYNVALRINGDNPDTLVAKGKLLYRRGNLDDAQVCFDKALALAPKHVEALYRKGRVLYDRRDWLAVMSLCQQATVLAPTHDRSWVLVGKTLFVGFGKSGEALKSLTKAAELNPRNVEAWVSLGAVTVFNREHATALGHIDKALALVPEETEALTLQAMALNGLSRFDEALVAADHTLRLDEAQSRAHDARGVALAGKEQVDAALAAFGRATALDSGNLDAWEHKGMVLHEIGGFEEALLCFGKVTEGDPGRAQAWFRSGKIHQLQENWNRALAAMDKVVGLDPRNAEAWLVKGRAHHQLHAVQEALKAYNTCLTLDQSKVDAWYFVGVLLVTEKPAKAVKALNKVIELDPKHIGAYYHEGLALNAMGHQDKAIALFDACLELDPELPEAWWEKGRLHVLWDQYEPGVAALSTVLRLQPDHADSRLALGSLHHKHEAWRLAMEVLDPLGGKEIPQAAVAKPLWRVARAWVLQQEASAAAAAKESTKARRAIKEALELNQGEARLWVAAADLFVLESSWAEAERFYSQSLGLPPPPRGYDRPEVERKLGVARFQGLLAKGREAMRTERYKEAAEALIAAQRLQPEEPMTFVLLGDLLQRSDKLAKAIDMYETALRKDGTLAGVPAKLEGVRFKRMLQEGDERVASGDFDGALRLFTAATKARPSEGLSYVHIGDMLLAQKRPVDAARAFGKAHSLSPMLQEAVEKEKKAMAAAGLRSDAIDAPRP